MLLRVLGGQLLGPHNPRGISRCLNTHRGVADRHGGRFLSCRWRLFARILAAQLCHLNAFGFGIRIAGPGDLISRRRIRWRLLALLMLTVAGLGAIMSSTGVVAIFIPVVLLVAARQKLAPGRLMMPLSFAGLISGMLTLVGTTANLVANSALEHAGIPGFGFFSFTPFGAAILAAGIGYMLIARRWLNRATDTAPPGRTRRRLMDLGFTEGARIRPALTTFAGDPRAYEVRGTTIALRRDQSSQVLVRPIEDSPVAVAMEA